MSIKQAFHWSFCYSWFLKSDLIFEDFTFFFLYLFKSETANMNNSKIDSFAADSTLAKPLDRSFKGAKSCKVWNKNKNTANCLGDFSYWRCYDQRAWQCPKQKDHGKCLMNTNIKLIRFSSAVDMNLISTNRIINGSFQKPNYVCDLLNNTD